MSHDRAGAIANYERSLALRENRTVSQRLAAVRAIEAAQWHEATIEEPSRELITALHAAVPRVEVRDDVRVQRRLIAPNGRREALLIEALPFMVLALRERGGAWTIVPFAARENPNGAVSFILEMAPPLGDSPTFVIREHWSHRACCDEDGNPTWTHGEDVHLVWLDERGVAHSVSLADRRDRLPDIGVDVTFTADGRVIVERPRGHISARVRGLLGVHDREDWQASRSAARDGG